MEKRHFAFIVSLGFAIFLCLNSLAEEGGKGLARLTPRTSDYCFKYFGPSIYDVARICLNSTAAYQATIAVDNREDGRSSEDEIVRGKIVVHGLLYSTNPPLQLERSPDSMPFTRDVRPMTIGMTESNAAAPFHGWGEAPMDKVEVVIFLGYNTRDGWFLIRAVPLDDPESKALAVDLKLLEKLDVRRGDPESYNKCFDGETNPYAEAIRFKYSQRHHN
jgi:hypothetical protein